MANRYWVGGTGNWDAADTTHWSATSGGAGGASVPTSSDTVTFDTASNATAYTVTITAAANCSDITIGNPASGALTLAGSFTLNVAGNFNIANITRTYTGTLNFTATTTGKTLTFNGETMASITVFSGVGGGWTIQDAWNNGTANISLTNGTLDTNGQTITCGNFSSSGSATRSLSLGASAVTCSGSSTAWSLGTGAGITFSCGTSTITLTSSGGDFAGGGQTYNNVVFTPATGGITHTVSGANTFANLTLTGLASTTNVLELSANQIVTGTLTLNGNSVINRLLVNASDRDASYTITAAVVSAQYLDLENITGAGAASWDLSAITGLSGDCGGNSGITFTTPQTNYWVGGTGSWGTASEWASSSGGVGGTGRPPLPQDTAIFDANSFSAGSQTSTQNLPRIGAVNWTGATNTPTWTTSTACAFYGNITLISGMTLTASTQRYTYGGKGSSTLTSAGKTWAKSMDVDCGVGTLTLADALVCTGMGFRTGTFTANNQNVTCSSSAFFAGTSPMTVNMGSGTWEFTGEGDGWAVFGSDPGWTINAGTSTIKYSEGSAAVKIMYGGDYTYNNFWFAGSGTIRFPDTGASFNDFKIDNPPVVVEFEDDQIYHFESWTVSGSAGNLITIDSIATGAHYLIKDGGGTVSADYLNIQHSVATPLQTWYAGANSTDNQSTPIAGSGWIFTVPPGVPRFQTNIGDTWKTVEAVKVNISDTWKDVVSVKVNVGDVWKDVF
jgi:hypothetical protein